LEKPSEPVTNSGDGYDHDLHSFLDLVDMSQHTCCGYSFILRLVDPISRLGHVTLLKNFPTSDLLTGFNKLMSLSWVQPKCVVYDSKIVFMNDLVELYPLVHFVERAHTDQMDKERILFLNQLKKWLKGYDSDWIRGIVTV
jgi:hypothetical protein